MRLKESLEEILSEHQGQVAIFVKKLGSNETIRINETMVFPSASTIKLVIMATAMKEVKEGKRNLDDLIELKNYNKCGGDGILKELNFKHKFQLKEIITLMIILSDNTATNILIDMLGMDNINSVAESLGLKFTRLRRKMMDSEAVKQGKENTTNAEELSRILEMIYEGKLVDSQHSFIMLDILKRQQVGGRLNLYLPEDVVIAHKTGDLDNLEHDVGIVYHPEGDYIISVLTKEVATNKDGKEIIGLVSKEVFNSIKMF